MRERELARRMVEAAEMSYNSFGVDYKATIMDYDQYFGKGGYNIELFAEECDRLGYDVVPLEDTPLSMMPLKGKLVVQKRRKGK